MLKAFLQGKWLGHPLHSMLVHLPIGLWMLSLVLDVASHAVADGYPLVRGAYYTMVVATLAALVAVFPGLADWLDIRDDHPAKTLGLYHMVLNLMVIALYGVNIAVRWDGVAYATASPRLWIGLSVLGVILVSISGYIGGLMVFDDGIGVGRHRRRGRTPTSTIALDERGAPDAPPGMVPLVRFDQFAERQRLRVEIRGVVIAVARVDGQVYAFQEFCTHRYGPLSEGAFHGTEVMCPWHKSCFDLRSGAVTNGPAKEPIRIFRTEVRDGIVFIEAPPPAAANPDQVPARAAAPAG